MSRSSTGSSLPQEDTQLRADDKGLWTTDAGETIDEFVSRGHRLFDSSTVLPTMTLSETALRHNVSLMAQFTRDNHLALAPHMKTHMSPALAQMQIDAGAWGVTVASIGQARVAFESGIKRVLLANELFEDSALLWLVSLLQEDRERSFICYVDSVRGVDYLDTALSAIGVSLPLSVVVELGYPGGRTGARTTQQAKEIARRAAAAENLELVGVACYEGGLPRVDLVREYIRTSAQLLSDLNDENLLPSQPVFTLGGSAYFDIVADETGRDGTLPDNAVVVLRSGAYLTHDDGVYVAKTPFNRIGDVGHLLPAIEVWARVTSRPEPQLVIVALGKRDAPYDEGLPVAKHVRANGELRVVDPSEIEFLKMDDQHGYLAISADYPLEPGDIVGFGISHPCTAFDKWRILPIVSDDLTIVRVIRTHF